MKFHLVETPTCLWKGLGTMWLQWVICTPNSAGHPAPAPSPITGRKEAVTCGKRGSQHQNSHPQARESKLRKPLWNYFSFPSSQKTFSSAMTPTPQFTESGVARCRHVSLYTAVSCDSSTCSHEHAPPGSIYPGKEFQKGDTPNCLFLLQTRIKVI